MLAKYKKFLKFYDEKSMERKPDATDFQRICQM